MDETQNTSNNGKPWQFKSGNPGKPPGTQNKLTRTVKEAVLIAFNQLQDDPQHNLLEWAKKNPSLFYQIAAKLIPTDIKADIQSYIQIEQITGMVIRRKDAA